MAAAAAAAAAVDKIWICSGCEIIIYRRRSSFIGASVKRIY
jgi:hypothetical protein